MKILITSLVLALSLSSAFAKEEKKTESPISKSQSWYSKETPKSWQNGMFRDTRAPGERDDPRGDFHDTRAPGDRGTASTRTGMR